jgi:hypothetical protein
MDALKTLSAHQVWYGEHALNVNKLVTMLKLLANKKPVTKVASAQRARSSLTEHVLTSSNAHVYTVGNHTPAETRSNKIVTLVFARTHNGNALSVTAQQYAQLMVTLIMKLSISSDMSSTVTAHMSWLKISAKMESVLSESLLKTYLAVLVVLHAQRLSSLCSTTQSSK